MPFITAQLINQCYYRDEFKLFLVYGPLGVGKSAYSTHVMAEVLGDKIKPDYKKWIMQVKPNYERVKDFIVFRPQDFVERCWQMCEKGQREKAIIWDDAGLWLFAMEFNDPFVKALLKYMNVARTNWGAMILTTPAPTWVLYKMRSFPQSINIKILKRDSEKKPGRVSLQRPRIARAYRSWVAPDFKKQGVRTIYEDHFDATMPQDFYEWYKPLRDEYAKEAAMMMKRELRKMSEKLAKEAEQIVETLLNP